MSKAIRFYETGGPEVLRLETVEVGEPGPAQVRVRHSYVAVNFIDIYYRMGRSRTGPLLRPACDRCSTSCGPLAPRRAPRDHCGRRTSGARSASKVGSSTSSAAIWTVRSVIVGIPSGRSFLLFGFGSQTRLTACGS